jgi:hypothetical protein
MSSPTDGVSAGEAAPQITYCFKWNVRRKRPGVTLSEAEARARHAKGDEYTAVIAPPAGNGYPILVTPVWKNDFVAVTFLDEVGRQYMEYSFTRNDETRLFLDRVFIWTYPDDDPKLHLADSVKREDIRYREDGYVKRIVIDETESIKDTTEYSGVPVDDNWEPVPEFGDYRSIARRERRRSASDEPTSRSRS